MKVFFAVVILLTCLPFKLFGQSKEVFRYEYPDQFPEQYKVDFISDYNTLLAQHPEKKSKVMRKLAESNSFAKKFYMERGLVYLNWHEAENYLNDVLKKILPENLKSRSNIHVYLTRSNELNAYALSEGSLYIHVGLLAEVEDEATLAYILGHELAHHLNLDSELYSKMEIKRYNIFRKTIPLTEEIFMMRNLKYSRKQEMAADDIGFTLAARAGYDLSTALKFMKYLGSEKNDLTSTHPSSTERMNALQNFLLNAKEKGKPFLVDEQAFNRIKRLCKYEIVNNLHNDFSFKEAIEKSIYYYLTEKDTGFAFLAAKSIQKYLYMHPGQHERKIFSIFEPDSLKAYALFTNAARSIINDTAKWEQLKDHDLFSQKSLTYDSFFRYFLSLSRAHDISGTAFLATIYSCQSDSAKSDSLFRALVQNSSSPKGNTKVVLFDQVTKSEDHVSGRYQYFYKMYRKQPAYFSAVDHMVGKYFPERTLISLSENDKDDYKRNILCLNIIYGLNSKYPNARNLPFHNLYYLIYEDYEFISDISQMDYLYIHGYTNKTKPIGFVLKYFLLPITIIAEQFGKSFKGSSTHYFLVEHQQVNFYPLKIKAGQKGINYKLRKPHVQNAVYYELKK